MDITEVQMYDDLSVRSKNIIISLGGVDITLEKYRQKSDFIESRNCGVVTAKELNFFFATIDLLRKEVELKNTNPNLYHKYSNLVDFYKSEKNKLSFKTNKILKQLEFQKNCNSNLSYYYFITDTFITTQNILNDNKIQHTKILNELSTLISRITNFHKENIEIIPAKKIPSIEDVEANLNLYFTKKSYLSKRANNILDGIANDIFIDSNLSLSSRILSLMTGEINLAKRKNLGIKTYKEISNFLKELKSEILNPQNHDNLSSKENLAKKKCLKNSVIKLFEGHLVEESYINNFIDENNYKIVELAIFLTWIKVIRNNKKSSKIFFKLFFEQLDKNSHTTNQLANEFSISKERIRQIKISLSNGLLLNQVIHKMDNELNVWNPVYSIPLSDLIVFDIDINGMNFRLPDGHFPTSYLYHLILKKLFKEEYICINDLDLKKLNSFKVKSHKTYIFLRKTNKVNNELLSHLFHWLNEEIINFELIKFDFDINILVKRFFNENEIIIDHTTLSNITKIVQLIKADFTGTVFERKGHKYLEKTKISELIVNFLLKQNRPLKTIEIQKHLNENHYFKTPNQLLRILKESSEVFSMTNSQWALNEWESFKEFKGTLRDNIINKLEKSDIPLHISEILKYISLFTETNERNIIGNLKLFNSKEILFLNCGFIGLSSKKYKQNWYELPKVNGVYFTKNYIKRGRKKHGNNLSNFISKELGYPLIHVEYLLAKFDK